MTEAIVYTDTRLPLSSERRDEDGREVAAIARLDDRGGGEKALTGGGRIADCLLDVREGMDRGGPDRRDEPLPVLRSDAAKEKVLLELGVRVWWLL